jgi:hypothetical protein
MATIAIPLLIVKKASDANQASYEEAICLATISGTLGGIAAFQFIRDEIFLDTVAE